VAAVQLTLIVVQLPMIAVLVAGIVLLVTRRATLAARSAQLAVAGCVSVLVGTLGSLAWSLSIPVLITDVGPNNLGVLSFVVGGTLILLDAAGLGLLIAGVLAGGARAPSVAPAASSPSSV
jgi:hypothetical protein